MWYSGTATFTSGSVEVIGDANVDFVNNIFPGDACIGPNGLPVEILRADSRGKLILATAYNGQTTTGPFRVQPTQDYMRSLALAAVDLKTTYGGYRDTILQGIFPGGSVAAPGVRGLNDQDTGVRWPSANVLALVTGGVDRATVDEQGRINFLAGSRPLGPAALGASGDAGLVSYEHPVVRTYIGDGTGYSARWSRRTGGVTTDIFSIADNGSVGIGAAAGSDPSRLSIFNSTGGDGLRVVVGGGAYAGNVALLGVDGQSNGLQITKDAANNIQLIFSGTGGAERARIDSAGNLLVGATSASNHVIARGNTEGDLIMQVQGKAHPGVAFFSVASGAANGAACAFALNKNSQTNRSINAAGTINGSGADSAEYMVKAAGCGIIAKGDVCGVDRDGKLTKTWADAISFVVKSTDPYLVGGDTWAAHLPARPEAPGTEPVAPIEPGAAPVAPVEPGPEPAEEGSAYVAWLQSRFAFAVAERDYAVALADWQAATNAYPAARASYEADHAEWVAAKAAYSRDLPAWEAELEAARVCVDRIAFCGQVPCNVTGDFEVGNYIVAAQDGTGIKAVAMKLDDMTMAQYARRIGKVWAIREGRAWIDVQHG